MMGILDIFRRPNAAAAAPPRAQSPAAGVEFMGLNDPALLEYIRHGTLPHGAKSLRNMAILRCVLIISNSIGMLPLNLMESGDQKKMADDHPAYRLLKRKPNDWLTPLEFKSLLQLRALFYGNAYARVIWSRGRPIALIPMETNAVTPKLSDGFRMLYEYTTGAGNVITLSANEVLHLRDLSLDGIKGESRLKLAGDVVELAKLAEESAMRVFKTGVMAGGAVEVPTPLSDAAYQRLKESLSVEYSGVENLNKWMIVEEGGHANKFGSSAADAQQVENRNHQIEEIARLFGVPRPLLMMDDTSWGSGIEQLAIFFVQYTLAPWFVAWEQALARVLLSESELERYYFKFNERALLRGTLKDQADFFAKALGAGGQSPWMTQNEVRSYSDMSRSDDPVADQLRNPMTQKGMTNEPDKTS